MDLLGADPVGPFRARASVGMPLSESAHNTWPSVPSGLRILPPQSPHQGLSRDRREFFSGRMRGAAPSVSRRGPGCLCRYACQDNPLRITSAPLDRAPRMARGNFVAWIGNKSRNSYATRISAFAYEQGEHLWHVIANVRIAFMTSIRGVTVWEIVKIERASSAGTGDDDDPSGLQRPHPSRADRCRGLPACSPPRPKSRRQIAAERQLCLMNFRDPRALTDRYGTGTRHRLDFLNPSARVSNNTRSGAAFTFKSRRKCARDHHRGADGNPLVEELGIRVHMRCRLDSDPPTEPGMLCVIGIRRPASVIAATALGLWRRTGAMTPARRLVALHFPRCDTGRKKKKLLVFCSNPGVTAHCFRFDRRRPTVRTA